MEDANLLVGFEHSDDAGVYKLNEDLALVMTADFITPPVDDPFIYGQIAAANSLSDIYAMGGKPLTCLNLVCFPTDKLDDSILHTIIKGALSKIIEAGAVLVGGHSVQDEEPKFGLSVTGLVHPDKFWTNKAARPGDVLILTKPVGSGVLLNANLEGAVSDTAMRACIDQMIQLNKNAAEVLNHHRVHAVTDITGFGLAGHGCEMARASDVTFTLDPLQIPVFDEADVMYERGFTTGVNASNRAVLGGDCDLNKLSDTLQELMVDPQTNGGLLVSIAEDQAETIIGDLISAGVESSCVIGRVSAYDGNARMRFASISSG
jgi:selenide,water dikinase